MSPDFELSRLPQLPGLLTSSMRENGAERGICCEPAMLVAVMLSLLYLEPKLEESTKLLRRIPLNVRAISAKNIYQKTTHSTVTF